MPDFLGRPFGVLLVWTVFAIALAWGYLPAPWRRGISLVTSIAGLACLSVALNSEGLRESPTTAAFLFGPTFVTGHASASASLPYYVLTAACLTLGTLGLAAADKDWPGAGGHRRVLRTAVGLSVFVVLVRFALEKAAAPAAITSLFGLVWLTPVVGAFLFLAVPSNEKAVRGVARSLLVYAVWVRGFVALVYVVASAFHLGSHFDVSAVTTLRPMLSERSYDLGHGSLNQAIAIGVLPQVFFWPIYTVLTGLLGAALVHVLASPWRPRVPPLRGAVEMVTARQDP